MKVARFKLALLLLLIFSSCSAREPQQRNVPTKATQALVTVKTDRVHYSPNEGITILIKNGHNAVVEYYGTCSLSLCELTDNEWMCAMKDCVAPMDILQPGDLTELTDNATGSMRGTFRYHFEYTVASSDSFLVAYSNEFTVSP